MNDMHQLIADIKLRLNIDHPSHEENYAFGYECALAGLSEADNPYVRATADYEQWLEGWWDGFYGEAPLFELYPVLPSATAENTEHAEHTENVKIPPMDYVPLITNVLTLAGVITATAVLGYQIYDMVA